MSRSGNTDEYIFQNATSNAAVPTPRPVFDGKFTVKVWSPTSDWDSASVLLYVLAKDDELVLVHTFTEADSQFAYFGETGTEEVFTGAITGSLGSSDLCMTISQ
jgi:hypothetical protein